MSEDRRAEFAQFIRDTLGTRVRFAEILPAELSCEPGFIVSASRSGSTLLRLIVDSHSRLCSPPESNFLVTLKPLLASPQVVRGLSDMGFRPQHVIARTREFAAWFYGSYARSVGKSRWVDKSGGTAYHLDFVRRLFPEAKFIMLYRHPLDVAESCNAMADGERLLAGFRREGESPFIAGARYWQDICRPMTDFQAACPGACHEIRYERLCTDPAGVLQPMFEFLGEPWEPAVMRPHDFQHDQGIGDPKAWRRRRIELNSDNYRHRPADEIEKARAAAEPLMSQLGYSV